jgi:galactoside O-acetyltransferase
MRGASASGGYWGSDELRELGFSVGENCKVSKRVEIPDTLSITLGDNVRVDAFVTITTGGTGYLEIGSNTHIADGVKILASSGVKVGEYVGIAPRATILSVSDDYSGEYMVGPQAPLGTQGGRRGPVILERFVVIGASSVVLPNTTICEGVSVGALSLVSRDLPPWGMYFGAPVRFLRPRSRDMLRHLPFEERNRSA